MNNIHGRYHTLMSCLDTEVTAGEKCLSKDLTPVWSSALFRSVGDCKVKLGIFPKCPAYSPCFTSWPLELYAFQELPSLLGHTSVDFPHKVHVLETGVYKLFY